MDRLLESGEHRVLEELSEAVRHEVAAAHVPRVLHEELDALAGHVSARRCAGVLVVDATRLSSWERRHGAQAFELVMGHVSNALHGAVASALGEGALIVSEHTGSDVLGIFPVQGTSSPEGAFVDLEELQRSCKDALLQTFHELPLAYQSALDQIALGSALLIHNSSVAPQRSIYRALRTARQDAQAVYGESQRQRNRFVGRVIAHRRIRTFYQPIMQMQGVPSEPELFGYEALSRPMEHEADRLGVHLFVAASRAELDGELDHTCRGLSMRRHPPLDDTAHLFVNCLPQTFYDDMRELDSLLETWKASGLTTNQLVLEVTENITREQLRRILPNINALRARGVRFALDDVGTGTANLELLAHMSPEFIKMDMSLTIGIARSQRKLDLANYLMELARRLDAKLIAEGIEREDDMAALRALGVPLGQGFLLGHPRPHEAFLSPEEASA